MPSGSLMKRTLISLCCGQPVVFGQGNSQCHHNQEMIVQLIQASRDVAVDQGGWDKVRAHVVQLTFHRYSAQ